MVFLKVHPGWRIRRGGLLVLLGCALDSSVLKSVPWAVIVMVCGVSVFIGVLEKTGGMDLFTTLSPADDAVDRQWRDCVRHRA